MLYEAEFLYIMLNRNMINVVSASIEKCQRKADRHIGIFLCQRTPQNKISLSRALAKKIKSAGRASGICAAKLQCVNFFPDTFNF